MNKRLFEKLTDSVRQHREIVRGERAPSRELHVGVASAKNARAVTHLSKAKRKSVWD